MGSSTRHLSVNRDFRKTCATLATNRFVKAPMGHTQNSAADNLQLVHLLTTNPAAALPAIFSTSASPQKLAFQMSRQNNSWTCGGLIDQVYIENERTGRINLISLSEQSPSSKRQCSFSELYVSKEDIDKKACCIDGDGHFDFEALLPAVYWKHK